MPHKKEPFWERVLKKVFPQKEKEGRQTGKKLQVPVHQEALERSEDYEEERKEWMEQGHHLPLLRSVHQAYKTKSSGVEPVETDLFLHESPHGKGFFFTYREAFGVRAFSFLFDLLRDRALRSGYRKYHSDRRILEGEEHYETIERHFLKPPINKEMHLRKGTQLYGKLLLEQNFVNDRPSYIKLMAHVVSDEHYHAPMPFEELVESLFANEEEGRV